MDEPYCGSWHAGTAWYLQWNGDPLAWALVAAAAVAVAAMRAHPQRRARTWALATMALLWLSPLCPLSASLLSVRVLHHLGVVLLLAPCLAAAFPHRRGLGAGAAASLTVVAMSAWFVPGVYSLAWRDDVAYWLLQAAMAVGGWQLWRAWSAGAGDGELPVVAGSVAMLALSMGFIGALLTFSPDLLLTEHALASPRAGLDAMADQRLAGLVMWTLGMLPLAWAAASGVRMRLRAAGG